MEFERCCGGIDEGKPVEIEYLVHQGRLLHAQAVFEALAGTLGKVDGRLAWALRILRIGGRKLRV